MAVDSKAWAGVAAALAPLGRAALLLDAEFRVLHATATLDTMVCSDASQQILGRKISDLLGAELFREGSPVATALQAGQRREGHRAFIQCGHEGARLVSVSVAPLVIGTAQSDADQGAVGLATFDPDARYIVVLRPAEHARVDIDAATLELGLITRAPAMLEVVRLIEALQLSTATVLITGESGVGKEVVARAIHTRSPRHQGPFVGVNCAALPGGLLESELFGHIRGSFTGADHNRVGRVELAAKGTLFLDELGDMPPALQAKLLRVLQEHQYERVGESTSRPFEARVIAATNVDIDEALESGQLRKDLYYRLRVVPVHIPPLRERMEDIEPLSRILLERIGGQAGRALRLSPEALRQLQQRSWPGNVRELENTLAYATAMCAGHTISVEHLEVPSESQLDQPVAAVPTPALPPGVIPELGEEARIRRALDEHHWRRADAARALDMSRTTLWRRMQALGIE